MHSTGCFVRCILLLPVCVFRLRPWSHGRHESQCADSTLPMHVANDRACLCLHVVQGWLHSIQAKHCTFCCAHSMMGLMALKLYQVPSSLFRALRVATTVRSIRSMEGTPREARWRTNSRATEWTSTTTASLSCRYGQKCRELK